MKYGSEYNGWQFMCDYHVLTLGGRVIKGVNYDGYTIYPCHMQDGKWAPVGECSISSFCRNIENGTYRMMHNDGRFADTYKEECKELSTKDRRKTEKTYYHYSYKAGSESISIRPVPVHANNTYKTDTVILSVNADGDCLFSMYSESNCATADFYDMISDTLIENARQAENVLNIANQRIAALNVARSKPNMRRFMTVDAVAEIMDSGETISFVPETEDTAVADSGSHEHYVAKISGDFGGRTLIVGNYGKGIVFSDSLGEMDTAGVLRKFLETNCHMHSDFDDDSNDVMLCVDVEDGTACTAHYAPPKDAAVAEMFPDCASISPGEWSSFGKTMKTANGNSIEIGLYREPDDNGKYAGTLTLQVFIGDDVVVCEQMSERADAGSAEE